MFASGTARLNFLILHGSLLVLTCLNLKKLQYYLEKNLDARERELEREAELDSKAPKVKAKSKMSKVNFC